MRKNGILFILSIVMFSLVAGGCGGTKQEAAKQAVQPVELNISAAVSVKDALLEIQTKYQAKAPNVKLVYNLGASGSLQRQIEQGAPADIFISAAPKQMNELEAKNMVDKATRKNLLENKLVLIVPKDSGLGITKFEDLTQSAVKKIAVGETVTVPAGQYAQQALQKLDLWETLKDKAVFAKDVRTVLSYVETGNTEAGFVYKTDAVSSSKIKVAAIAPEGSHQPIVYPAAILAGTKNHKAAEEFLAYLNSEEGKSIFEKYGFTMSK